MRLEESTDTETESATLERRFDADAVRRPNEILGVVPVTTTVNVEGTSRISGGIFY